MVYTTDFEKLKKQLNFEPDPTRPVSKQASENTVRLFDYLKSIYGKSTLQVSSICKAKR